MARNNWLTLMDFNGSSPLLREAPNTEGDRQSHHHHVDKQALDQVTKFVRPPGVECGQRQDDKIHDLFHGGAIK